MNYTISGGGLVVEGHWGRKLTIDRRGAWSTWCREGGIDALVDCGQLVYTGHPTTLDLLEIAANIERGAYQAGPLHGAVEFLRGQA